MKKVIRFVIRIQGLLSPEFEGWFEDVEISSEEQEDGSIITVLSGETPDQSALHGLLNRIRDVGLKLLSMEVEPANPGDD